MGISVDQMRDVVVRITPFGEEGLPEE